MEKKTIKVKKSTVKKTKKKTVIETVKNETVDTPIEIHKKRKFTLDIIELLDGKVNKNIVFFGFLLLVFAVSLQGIEHLHHNQCPIYVKRINASNITLSYTLFCYWAYLMVKHGFILKSLLLLILLRLLLTFSF
ncbi:MAG: hypothetical protein IJE43_15865 [Alphaproteobacteria bacterium]|nr:hypothetical protein [Alphaproteobacteria bacterium]